MRGTVDVSWLKEHLRDENIIILDASQSTSVNTLDQTLEGKYIIGAVLFNLKLFSDPESSLPNTLPKPEYFQEKCRELGINKVSQIIVYDNQGVYFSPRVWWMFKVMGHENVAVLDGGLPAWIANEGEISNEPTFIESKGNFHATLNESLVKSYQQVLQNIDDDDFLVVDARSQGRFNGTESEPREGLSSGHIPGSLNIPYKEVLNGIYLKSDKEISATFDEKAIDTNQTVFSCGSGLTACIVALASYKVNKEVRPIYDGSWTEWAQVDSSPINLKKG